MKKRSLIAISSVVAGAACALALYAGTVHARAHGSFDGLPLGTSLSCFALDTLTHGGMTNTCANQGVWATPMVLETSGNKVLTFRGKRLAAGVGSLTCQGAAFSGTGVITASAGSSLVAAQGTAYHNLSPQPSMVLDADTSAGAGYLLCTVGGNNQVRYLSNSYVP